MDGGAAAPAGALLGRRLVLAGTAAGVVAGGEQAVRRGSCPGRRGRAGPVGAGRGAAPWQVRGRRHGALRRPRERRRLHRGRARALPPVQRRRWRLPCLRVHPGLGRRRRRPGLQALLLHRRRQARAGARSGAQEGRALDRGGAQIVLDGPEEVRERGLAEHLAQLRHQPDAHAGCQPRPEVLHPAQLRRQGQAPLQHPRHHHRQHPRRRPWQQPLALAALLRAHAQLLLRRRSSRNLGAVRRARRQQAPNQPRRPPPLHPSSLRQRQARGQQRLSRRPPRRLCSDADAMRPAPASRLTTVFGAATGQTPLEKSSLYLWACTRRAHARALLLIPTNHGVS